MTSKEMELKLTNVAKGSMQELLQDYQDYLMLRQLKQWDSNDPRAIQTRNFCKTHNSPEDYQSRLDERSDETIANIAITLLHQYDYLITRLIETQKRRFLEEGGIKEEMYRARIAVKNGYRNQQATHNSQGVLRASSHQSSQNSQNSQNNNLKN